MRKYVVLLSCLVAAHAFNACDSDDEKKGNEGGAGGNLVQGGGAGTSLTGGSGGTAVGGAAGSATGGGGAGGAIGGAGGSAVGGNAGGGAGGAVAIDGMSFFITSVNPGRGGDLGGLDGADAHCKALATAVGAGNRQWRAYLSTDTVDAKSRIGDRAWKNQKGVVVATSLADLHSANNKLGKANSLDEKGNEVNGAGQQPNRHDIITGSNADGTKRMGANCLNWTSAAANVMAVVGHHDRQGGGEQPMSWNAAHVSRGCSLESLRGSGGDGLFYCFAAD